MSDAAAELRRLLEVMAALRDPKTGCPWDREQRFETIAPYTIEEAYEVADAIERRDMTSLQDELGDLLFQVVYHARMAEEAGLFGFAEVARGITEKMIRRHPHVFGDRSGVLDWEGSKSAERAARAERGTLTGVPRGAAGADSRAEADGAGRSGRVRLAGWGAVLEKLDEEVAELRAELPEADPARLADEVGDLLFVVANLARKLGLDPETCLRGANEKFSRRFDAMEQGAEHEGKGLAELSLEEMEARWQTVKRSQTGGG